MVLWFADVEAFEEGSEGFRFGRRWGPTVGSHFETMYKKRGRVRYGVSGRGEIVFVSWIRQSCKQVIGTRAFVLFALISLTFRQ